MTVYKKPKISICQYRNYISVACYDGFDCVRGFVDYPNEKEKDAIRAAYSFFADKTGGNEPEIVRPQIRKTVLKS